MISLYMDEEKVTKRFNYSQWLKNCHNLDMFQNLIPSDHVSWTLGVIDVILLILITVLLINDPYRLWKTDKIVPLLQPNMPDDFLTTKKSSLLPAQIMPKRP